MEKEKGVRNCMNKCCICGNIAHYARYPQQCIRKNGSKSISGIDMDSVKYYCTKCYKSIYI